jgi:DNA-binding transcriptional MerR regulator
VAYRVDELAEQAGITIQLLRSYQSKGLLPPPQHDGRIALYNGRHLERLLEIRQLKQRGYSLRAIGQILEPGKYRGQPSDSKDEPLTEESFSLQELAERSGVPVPMLRSLEASGLLRGRQSEGDRRYSHADVKAVRLILTLVSGGLPMDELIRVARIQLGTAQQVAEECVSLFMAYVREPLQKSGLPQKDEADQLVAALRLTLHSSAALLAYNFQRMMLNTAQQEINRSGTRSERAALQREILRRLELELP